MSKRTDHQRIYTYLSAVRLCTVDSHRRRRQKGRYLNKNGGRMGRKRRYTTSSFTSIQLACERFGALAGGLLGGRPETVTAELSKIRRLIGVIDANLPAQERLYKSRSTWGKIREIEKSEFESRSLLKQIFQGKLSKEACAKIDELKKSIPQGDTRSEFPSDTSGTELRVLRGKLASYEKTLLRSLAEAKERERARAVAAAIRAENQAITKARKDEKKARLLALAAAHESKTRSLAQAIRRDVKLQQATLSDCPYCGSPLTDPHADHIYPVAKGGLSTLQNMVFVCADCNGRKSDRTLREFIKIMGFDQSAVETRLERLGKSF
ncbi:HNH endonuclease [Paraburkholderia xenovorans]|uniref:HNH endonuclease n=1 Tax=Paraburkholderia xenovorans TaxID=36873 RepID=UPI0038BD6211